jgi:hypothetical protein
MTLRLLLLAASLLAFGASRAETPAEKAGFEPKLIIYLARGAANSCGPGCDRWIAVEGQVDQGAAERVRHFLRGVKDTRRPIYFHSPGGAVEQAYAIGRLLRSRKAIARVGRTILTGCAVGFQIDAACLKIKTAGGEVDASIQTRRAMCNSACGYLFLGATTREVAPDAAIGVHNSKLTLIIHGPITLGQIAEIRERDIAKANRERSAFIAAMGINHELDDLIKTVKFETVHLLTRVELYRFGIDTRALSDTAWMLETADRPYIRKFALARKADGSDFRAMEWRLFCENKQRARLMFVREFDPEAAGKVAVILMAGSDKSLAFGKLPARAGKYEVWSDTMTPDAIKPVLDAPRLQMGEGSSGPAGRANTSIFEIDNSGLQQAWAQLLTSCPAAPAQPVVASPAPVSIPVQ